MDAFTHGLLGATVAQLGFRQRIGRDATWVLAVAAVLPDLDSFVGRALSLTGAEDGDLSRLLIHRGLSHSLLFAPLLGLVVAGLWWQFRRRYVARPTEAEELELAQPRARPPRPPSFLLLFLCAYAAVVSHPLLDWCTSYGTCLLSPLTNARFAIDAVSVIDFIYTPLLVGTLLACAIVRRAGGHARRATLIIGWTGFGLSVGYLAAGRVLHDRAIDKALAAVGGGKVVRADAYPAPWSIFLWRAVVETDDAWHAVRVHHMSHAPPSELTRSRVAKTPPDEWIERAKELPEYEAYRWFAAGRLRATSEKVGGLHIVRFHDMRYSAQTDGVESIWPLVATFDERGNLVSVGRESLRRWRSWGALAGEAWRDLSNP